MKRSTMILAATLLAAPVVVPSTAHAGLSPDSARVFKGVRGEEVVLVMLQPASDGNALVRFSGTTGVLDGMVLPCKRVLDGNDERYRTSWRGRDYSFLQADLRGGSARWHLYSPPDVRIDRALKLDEAATKAAKPKDVISLHEKQVKDGSLGRFASFNRADEQAGHDREYAEALAAANKACGGKLTGSIAWASVTDEVLKQYSIGGYCTPPLSALSSLCAESPVGAQLVVDKIKDVTCSFSGPMKLALAGGTLAWTVNSDASNTDDFAKKALEELEVAAPLVVAAVAAAPGAGGEAPPWGEGKALGQRISLARTAVCSDGKSHYVVAAPRGGEGARLYYGDGKKLARVPLTEMAGGYSFFEPRFVNPTSNPNFRGIDFRLQSEVEYDAQKGSCATRCGTRKTTLKILPAAEAEKLLTSASFQSPVNTHTAHALTRDDKGNYYYVDKGNTPDTAKKYRLFAGPKGNLKLQAMTNVIADSKGEIFSTKKGELRFIVGPGGTESTWVAGKARTRLTAVPVEENWQMIYTDLGVYVNERLGTPCDDL